MTSVRPATVRDRSSETAVERPSQFSLLAGGAAAVLSVLVAVVHVIDQGGIPGSKTPGYVGVGYWLLELAAIAVAVGLLYRARPVVWLAALSIGIGPAVGFVLSRGPGLPAYTDDRGNWGEPLGIVSLVVEGLLIIVSLAALATLATTRRTR